MGKAFVLRFLKVDAAKVRSILLEVHAVCEKKASFVRECCILSEKREDILRVKEENGNAEFIHRRILSPERGNTKDTVIAIRNFDAYRAILKHCGFQTKNYQIYQEEFWRLHDLEFRIHTDFGLEPFLEILGSDFVQTKDIVGRFGYDWDDGFSDSREELYDSEKKRATQPHPSSRTRKSSRR